jgi:hypothetical protein
MTLPIILFFLVLAPMIWVTVRGKDAWPFSHYPMFSRLTGVQDVEIFRVALETKSTEVVWWRSKFHRYPEFVGRQLRLLERQAAERGPTAAIGSLEKQRYLAEVLRLIEGEEGCLEQYEALLIVKRRIQPDHESRLLVKDELIFRVPLDQIKRVRCAD